ncbi:beta-galactoside alpha-2,6-sialyltransferase 1-like [Branchiostoma floridae]|uniref:beta-galactoside alpha-(2,6)-sialyltransferase n=1 Tax=Branchiostoma floridae TaxID=7739 RepID=A0A9J7K7B6_BRAFL|nr:beta-galactoside alpha-2,6-sialyltransferase 1-like [Branchiostoma floridae]XP_035659692.1 beta-galactoside alpha-2,6-sialyltransferase 1-like [Branchiostoma floridae]XP_035659694.1 beta-galactoside alpha-2,6-sialyltransferase 1-like [Branchiostoma floridae]XP_035659695.1 beta-galactoside alpha-2,6-sialyltransferase 1-like [Branchiostoma floridae]
MMAEKTTLFIGALCLCILANALLTKYPITVTIGSPRVNTTGLQFQMVGIGVPTALKNGRNVLPSMYRRTVEPTRGVTNSTHNVTNMGHESTWNTTHKPPLGKNTTMSNSTFVEKTGNGSLSNNTRESPETLAKWREDMYCKMKTKIPFSTINKNSTNFENRSDEEVLPEESLENLVSYNSCAIVSSSHALMVHKYGGEIDAHDAILRFNCAPTDKFEEFVGSRTDMRLINTKIPGRTCKKEFWNDSIAMFNHEFTVVRNFDAIRLKPRGIDTKKDRFRVFENLKKFRRTHPNRTMPFIQRPNFGKDIVTELGRFCSTTGRCKRTSKSPSTGMFGIVMMLHLCNWVHVYEILPSNKDDTNLRYYYDEKAKLLKPTGGVHSYSQEQQYIRTLSLTSDQDIANTGVALLKGLAKVRCD